MGSSFLSWWSFSVRPHRGADLIGRSRVRPAESSLRIWNTKRTRTATWASVLLLEFRTAIEMWEDCRGMARDDPDFDSIRDLSAFQELFSR
jgi:hypothetical protein